MKRICMYILCVISVVTCLPLKAAALIELEHIGDCGRKIELISEGPFTYLMVSGGVVYSDYYTIKDVIKRRELDEVNIKIYVVPVGRNSAVNFAEKIILSDGMTKVAKVTFGSEKTELWSLEHGVNADLLYICGDPISPPRKLSDELKKTKK